MRIGGRLLARCLGIYWPNGQSWDSRTSLLRSYRSDLYDRDSTAGPQAHGVAAGAYAASGANLHAAGGTNVHASHIDGKTCR
jgi:hypothetical protein